MTGREVEGAEVVEVVFDLGTFGDREAEPDEHVLESFGGLGDEVLVPVAAPAAGELGEVEPLGLEPLVEVVGLE